MSVEIEVKFVKKCGFQSQLNFSHHSSLKLLVAAGLDSKVRLGFKRGVILEAKTAEGTKFVFGDSHAIWASHQSDERVAEACRTMEKGQAFSRTFVEVSVKAGEGEDLTEEVDLEF